MMLPPNAKLQLLLYEPKEIHHPRPQAAMVHEAPRRDYSRWRRLLPRRRAAQPVPCRDVVCVERTEPAL